MEPTIYIRYVAFTIVICTSMLEIEFFYHTQPSSFHGCFFEYLPIFLHLQVCGISLIRFKEFRTFWPCYFVDTLVKVTDNFWEIRGLIDGFNESRRKIASGVVRNRMALIDSSAVFSFPEAICLRNSLNPSINPQIF